MGVIPDSAPKSDRQVWLLADHGDQTFADGWMIICQRANSVCFDVDGTYFCFLGCALGAGRVWSAKNEND